MMIPTFAYIRAVVVGIAIFSIAALAILLRHEMASFDRFRTMVEENGKQAVIRNKRIVADQKQITIDTINDYEKKLSDLRAYYAPRIVRPSAASSGMPGISIAPRRIDENSANTSFAELEADCAETTLMLEELQTWTLQQSKIK